MLYLLLLFLLFGKEFLIVHHEGRSLFFIVREMFLFKFLYKDISLVLRDARGNRSRSISLVAAHHQTLRQVTTLVVSLGEVADLVYLLLRQSFDGIDS